MESSGSGNVEPKRSAFKIRTKVGSQQGMRQSALMGDGGGPGLKPMPKREDRMANPSMAHSSLHKHQLILQKEALKQEEKKQEQEGPTDQDIVEKGEDYVVHNLKSKQANIKSSGNVKMNRTYSYQGLEIFSTRFSPDDTSLAIGLSDGTIEIKILASNKKGELFQTSPDELPVSHIRWKSNKRLICANVEGFLIEYDTVENTQIASLREVDNQILALDYCSELSKIATAGKDANVRIYDDVTKRLVRTYEKGSWYSPGHSNRIFSAKFKNRDPNMLITGGWDSSIFIWDVREPKNVAAFVGPNVSGDTIDTKDNVMLIGSHRARDSIELWDFGTRKKICDIDIEPGKTNENAYIYACQYSKLGEDQVITGMAVRNEIRIFDRNIMYVPTWSISGFDRAIYTLDWGNKGKKIAFGGGAGKAYVFKFMAPSDRD